MARLELIQELEIRRKEIYSEIKIKLPELTEQLEAIDKIIGSMTGVNSLSNKAATSQNTIGTPKGDMSWLDYVFFMLNEIGGKGKSRDVANAIEKANADINIDRAINASQDKLSRLLKEGKIDAIKPAYKKDGYLYKIK
ncbi:hypothetical protein [Yeosuana sp.]|uniref:hypothetical protein n=1 Tax=Yeosuana sp. TaxID=2529388 RepID=UPI004054D2DD